MLAVAAPSADAIERTVDMPGKFFVPPNLTALAGDTVTWTNSDQFDHDVSALNGAFDSGHVSPGGRFSHQFTLTGHYAYRCTIHPFMAGTVDVYAFQLLGPDRRDLRRLGGDAARHRARGHERGADRGAPPGRHVGAGPAVAPEPDGSFRARVTPDAPSVYRAIADAGPSLPLPLRVGARARHEREAPEGRALQVSATARPAQTGALAALQLYSRERFRWRQVAHARVDGNSRVSFTVSPPGHYAARVVLLNGKGGYGASVGKTVHLGGRRGAKPAPPREHHHPMGDA